MAFARKPPAPLALPVAFWAMGIFLGSRLQFSPLWALIPAALSCLAAWLVTRFRLFLILVLCLICGALRFESSSKGISALANVLQQRNQLRQELVFRPTKVFSAKENRYEIGLYSLAGKRIDDKLLYYSATPLQPDFWYRGIADIRAIERDPLLDIFPDRYAAIAYQMGALTRMSKTGTSGWVAKLRLKLLHNLDSKLGDQAIWAKGLLLSDTEAKNDYLNSLSNSGLIHLIVVSGMHVWFIYLVMMSILRIFIGRETAEMLLLPLVLLFAALNNFAPPITRAIIMIGTLVTARQMQIPLSGLQALSIALWVITLISPGQLFNIGLQLSFIAVLVMIIGVPRFRIFSADKLLGSPVLRFFEQSIEVIMVSGLISLAISPLTLYHFGRASFNGIIGNLIGIPVIGILMPVSVLVLITPQNWMIGLWLKLVYSFLVHLWSLWIGFCAELPFSFDGFYAGQNFALALALAILWMFILLRGRFRLALYSFVPIVALSGGLLLLPESADRVDRSSSGAVVYAFNAGVADCSYIKLPGGQNLMVDTGGLYASGYAESIPTSAGMQDNSWLQKRLLPWLSRRRIRQIDALVLSHLHADHCGGFPALATGLKVKNVFISAETLEQPLWKDFVNAGYLKHSRVHVLSDTISYRIGDSYLKFLPMEKSYFDLSENNLSLVCRLDCSGQRILFTGDIENDAEKILVHKYAEELKADFLKVPHHGSRSSSSDVFLSAVRAREAWLSVSRHNRFRFPHPETLNRYQRYNIRLQSTEDGSIRKVIDTSPLR